MSGVQEWRLTNGDVVVAVDQHAAWNTLRNRPASEFGLIVGACPNGNDEDTVYVHTAALMFAWGRDEEGRAFVAAAEARGLGNSLQADMAYACDHGRRPSVVDPVTPTTGETDQ